MKMKILPFSALFVFAVPGFYCDNGNFQLFEESGNVEHAPSETSYDHTLIGNIQDTFNQMTRDEALQSFLVVCGKFGVLSDDCNSIAATYFTEIYSYLSDSFNPTTVCSKAGGCAGELHRKANAEITPVSQKDYVTGPADDLPCNLCKGVSLGLRNKLANINVGGFKNLLEGLCNKASSFKTECNTLVDQNYVKVYKLFVSALSSPAFCTSIGLCSNSIQSESPFLPENVSDDACTLCTLAVSRFERMTEEMVEYVVSKLVCSFLLSNNCENSVEIYTKIITEWILGKPRQVCVYLNICGDKETPYSEITVEESTGLVGGDFETNVIPVNNVNEELINYQQQQQQSNIVGCSLCTLIMGEVQKELKGKSHDIHEIKRLVHNICNLLPFVRRSCNSFIDQYSDTIIRLIVNATSPTEICSYINMSRGNLQIQAQNVKIFECAACRSITKFMKIILKTPGIDHSLNSVLGKVCNMLPLTISKAKCQRIVDKYGEQIFNLLIKSVSEGKICNTVRLCAI